VSQREQYVVVDAGAEPRDVATVCVEVIDILRDTTAVAHVDAYSDFEDHMPADIRAAEAWLRTRGLARGTGDPGLAIAVESDDEVGWVIARAYAPWSTRVALFDTDDINIATLQHGGQFVTVTLTAELVAAVTAVLGPAAALTPLTADDAADGDDRLAARERSGSWFRRPSAH
jgi:hypothetical protein